MASCSRHRVLGGFRVLGFEGLGFGGLGFGVWFRA